MENSAFYGALRVNAPHKSAPLQSAIGVRLTSEIGVGLTQSTRFKRYLIALHGKRRQKY